jgi:hypothetical protein
MATVNIVPIPDGFRRHPERWWPCYPPIFEGEVTQEDRELALELWRALDAASRRWYVRFHSNPDVREFVGLPLTERDRSMLRVTGEL